MGKCYTSHLGKCQMGTYVPYLIKVKIFNIKLLTFVIVKMFLLLSADKCMCVCVCVLRHKFVSQKNAIF